MILVSASCFAEVVDNAADTTEGVLIERASIARGACPEI